MGDDQLETSILGQPFKVRSKDLLPWIMVAVMAMSLGWMVYFSLQMWGEPVNLKLKLQEHDVMVSSQHQAYLSGISELTYIMSVCLNSARLDECKQLRIAMPDSLYQKVKRP